MKVYIFHHIISGLEPTLYGFTEELEIAKLFDTIRKNMYLKVLELSKGKYMEFRDTHKTLRITMNPFATKNPNGSKMIQILQPTTELEYMNFVLHKDDILLSMLEEHTLPIEIFSKRIQKNLSILRFDAVREFHQTKESLPFNWNGYSAIDLDWRIDEFELFVRIHKNMIK